MLRLSTFALVAAWLAASACSASGSGGGGAPLDGGAGTTGGVSGSGGSSGVGGSMTGGATSTGGASGSGSGASGGTSATGGASGSGGTSGLGGTAGSGGSSGSGGASGSGGSSGSGGASGTGGASGSGGTSGSGGSGGTGGSGSCTSGATGNHALRFRWAGNGPNSTAYVVYEANDLPDTSNWHVGAYSQNIGYTPVFTDTFLGVGGLDLSGTVFIDVDLSTQGLSSIKNVTLSIYGRSFNTTTSGSFTWQTFQGSGASPYGGVSNVAPYQWYGANATAAFAPGNGGVLLRIKAGGPSSALVVNRVEVCFDAT